jgi:hypothetical protein
MRTSQLYGSVAGSTGSAPATSKVTRARVFLGPVRCAQMNGELECGFVLIEATGRRSER